MGISFQEIAAVVKELAPVITGAWIQKVFQPAPRAITLETRAAGRTLALLLSADPDTGRLHLLSQRYPNPAIPPPLCQFLRARIQGARIERIEQVPGDRIVRLRLTTRDGPHSLIAELTGRRANLLLLDEHETVLAALDARGRVGQAYQQPPVPADLPDIHAFELPPADRHTAFPISYAIEERYRLAEEKLALARLRRARLTELKRRIKKATRRLEVLQSDLEKAARYREYARYGELLKANLHQMTKGQDRVTVVDYFDAALPELVIPLDPAKSPRGNMEEYFRKHRKYLTAEREIRPRLHAEERNLTALQAERTAIEQGDQPSPSFALSAFSSPSALAPTQRRSGPFRRFTSADGVPIYVGRNARENEALTFREARPDDLWLHALSTPGSHVIVRLKGADPPIETIRDAATLALLYSDLKKSGKGEVIYTRRKYVRKVKAKTPGTVTVTQEQTIFVTLDSTRLDRLKEHRT
jgi:predicted ribosome quality control (RQC) complex YloA/Tae2 family protein